MVRQFVSVFMFGVLLSGIITAPVYGNSSNIFGGIYSEDDSVDPDFLYLESIQVEDKSIIEEVDNYLQGTDLYSDWYLPEAVYNPLTGEEVYTIRVYRKDKDDWWTRISISL